MKPAQENYQICLRFLTKRPTDLREPAARFEVKGTQQSELVSGQFLLHMPRLLPTSLCCTLPVWPHLSPHKGEAPRCTFWSTWPFLFELTQVTICFGDRVSWWNWGLKINLDWVLEPLRPSCPLPPHRPWYGHCWFLMSMLWTGTQVPMSHHLPRPFLIYQKWESRRKAMVFPHCMSP